MRWLVLVLAVVGCKKEPPQAPVSTKGSAGSGSGSAIAGAPADAPAPTGEAPPARVELLHSAPTDIYVSSKVANKKILPAHLVDRDLNTAWNSATGDLAGAWISVAAKDGAQIEELRLTVGHTGKGPKGEDYFTMNPRIRTLTVMHDSDVIATAKLDIARRDLQTIALPSPVDHVKLRVDEVVPGSKKTWRETCVSELEAWGTLGPGKAAKPTTPNVEVGEPIAEPDPTKPIADPVAYCASLTDPIHDARKKANEEAAKAEAECVQMHPDPGEQMMCYAMGDAPDEPLCSMSAYLPINKGPWVAAGTLDFTNDQTYGARNLQPVVRTTKGYFVVGTPVDCGKFSDAGPCDHEVTSAKPHGNELDLVSRVTFRSGEWHEYAMHCTYADGVTCDPETETGTGSGSGAP